MALLYLKTPRRYKSDLTSDLLKLYEGYIWYLILLSLWFFYYRVSGRWNGKRRVLTIQGMKSKICFLGTWIYSHLSPSHLTVHAFESTAICKWVLDSQMKTKSHGEVMNCLLKTWTPKWGMVRPTLCMKFVPKNDLREVKMMWSWRQHSLSESSEDGV